MQLVVMELIVVVRCIDEDVYRVQDGYTKDIHSSNTFSKILYSRYRVTTHLEKLEKSWNFYVFREK